MTFVPCAEAASVEPAGVDKQAPPLEEEAGPPGQKRPPTAKARGAVLLKAALEALDQAGGAMTYREMLAAVPSRVPLIPSDVEVSRKSGKLRWRTLIHLYSIGFARAGFIRKHLDRWELTPEGRALLALPAEEFLDKAKQRYNDWKAGQPVIQRPDAIGDAEPSGANSAGAAPAGAALVDAFVADVAAAGAAAMRAGRAGPPKGSLLLETARGYARSEIESFVSAMAPYDFQELVAALLRAMGYTISFVSSRGADGGTDILAYPDALGARTPHIRVQVKHREDKATREEVAALRGIIRPGREIGLFVSSGGFTSGAVREARHGAAHIELMDWDGVLDKWLAHYKRLRKADRRRLRLRPVYFLAAE